MKKPQPTPWPWKATRSHEGYNGSYIEFDSPQEEAEYNAKPFVCIESEKEVVAHAHDCFEFKPEDVRMILASCGAMFTAAARLGVDPLELAESLAEEGVATLTKASRDLLDQLDGIGIPDWKGAEGLSLVQVQAALARIPAPPRTM